MTVIKTYVIHGLLTRPPGGRGTREKYAYTDLVYNVDESVSFDDIDYILRKANIHRTVPIDIRTNQKLDFVIGMDKERVHDGGPVLNRVALNKKLIHDINNLDWVQPQR